MNCLVFSLNVVAGEQDRRGDWGPPKEWLEKEGASEGGAAGEGEDGSDDEDGDGVHPAAAKQAKLHKRKEGRPRERQYTRSVRASDLKWEPQGSQKGR